MTSYNNSLFFVLGGLLGTTMVTAFGIIGYVVFSDVALAEAQMVLQPQAAVVMN
jgi:hypothetical protein